MANRIVIFALLILPWFACCKSAVISSGEDVGKGSSVFDATRESCDFIVISDLDDTVKISHSTSTVSTIGHSLFDKDIYAGMNALFRVFFKCNKRNDTNLILVSASPQFLDGKINKLLRKHNFPEMRLYLKDWISSDETYKFKVDTITDIMDKTSAQVILIGDDTSKDPMVYAEIKKRFPERILDIYIHRVTKGRNIPSDSNHFYTAFDIAIREMNEGRMREQDLLEIAGVINSSDDLNGVIPHFGMCPVPMLDCSQFNGKANLESACQEVARKIIQACEKIDE